MHARCPHDLGPANDAACPHVSAMDGWAARLLDTPLPDHHHRACAGLGKSGPSQHGKQPILATATQLAQHALPVPQQRPTAAAMQQQQQQGLKRPGPAAAARPPIGPGGPKPAARPTAPAPRGPTSVAGLGARPGFATMGMTTALQVGGRGRVVSAACVDGT